MPAEPGQQRSRLRMYARDYITWIQAFSASSRRIKRPRSSRPEGTRLHEWRCLWGEACPHDFSYYHSATVLCVLTSGATAWLVMVGAWLMKGFMHGVNRAIRLIMRMITCYVRSDTQVEAITWKRWYMFEALSACVCSKRVEQ